MPDPRVREARLLAHTGRPAEALAAADAVLDAFPEHREALLLKALLLQEQGAFEPALALYERLVRLFPDAVEAWNDRARCLHALRRDREALEAARRAQALLAHPLNAAHLPAVSLTLIWCLREMRLLREALDVAEACLARTVDAVVAEWAEELEHELVEAERERC